MSFFQPTNFCIKVFVAIFFLFFCANTFSGYRYSYKSFELKEKIKEEFVDKGVCLKKNHCYGKQFLTHSGSEDSIYIDIYRSDELGKELLKLVIDLCVDEYFNRGKKVKVVLKVYKEKIDDVNALLFFAKPFITLEMKGEK